MSNPIPGNQRFIKINCAALNCLCHASLRVTLQIYVHFALLLISSNRPKTGHATQSSSWLRSGHVDCRASSMRFSSVCRLPSAQQRVPHSNATKTIDPALDGIIFLHNADEAVLPKTAGSQRVLHDGNSVSPALCECLNAPAPAGYAAEPDPSPTWPTCAPVSPRLQAASAGSHR
jgi:hypothetical protein